LCGAEGKIKIFDQTLNNSMKRIISTILMYWLCLTAEGQKLLFTITSQEKQRVVGQNSTKNGLCEMSLHANHQIKQIGWQNNAMYGISAYQHTILLASVQGILQSKDSGKTWKVITDWRVKLAHEVYQDTVKQCIYATTPQGLWRTKNEGKDWEQIFQHKQPSAHFVHCLLAGKQSFDTLFIGTSDGIWAKYAPKKKWKRIALQGAEIHTLVRHPKRPNTLMCATEKQGIWLSHDNGKTWHHKSKGLPTQPLYTIAAQPPSHDVWYVGGHQTGLWVTYDCGENWQTLTPAWQTITLHSIHIAPQNPHVIWVGTWGNGLYKSEDAGKNFQLISQGNEKIWAIIDAK
jgi:photosystem II stability/assembly factor-like uncharacterized protein